VNIAPEKEVASPCVGVCELQPETRLCAGCLRTVAEITEWRNASAHRRVEILAAVADRRPTGTGSPAPDPD